MAIKVLNCCTNHDHSRVFASGLTNVQANITVTDTANSQVRAYRAPLRSPFQPIQDTAAFQACP